MIKIVRCIFLEIKYHTNYSLRNVALSILIVLIGASIIFGDVVSSYFVHLVKSSARASSTLIEKGKPESYYGPQKAVDRDISTAWCANAKGNAIIGQSISIEPGPTPAKGFSFFPGYGASGRLFMANNRITKAKVTITDSTGVNREFLTGAGRANCYDERDPINEKAHLQSRRCEFDSYGTPGKGVDFNRWICVKKIVIRILAVERGLQYDDTCIAETALIVPGGPDYHPSKEDNEFKARCR